MKIVKLTPNRLKRLAYNLLKALYTVLCGSGLVFAGLIVVLIFGEHTTLTCQRVELTQGSCQLVTSGLLGSDETTIPLNQLKNAQLKLISNSRGRGGYGVVLLTADGELPFISVWSHNLQEKQKKADLINVFIGHPEERYLRVQQDDRWSIYSIGGFFILWGGLVMLSSLGVLIKG